MKSVATVAALFLSHSDLSEASTAKATFGTNTDVSGTVTVEGGSLSIDIDLSGLNGTLLPTNCTVGGLKYQLHSSWNYDNDTNDYFGPVACNHRNTGYNYDPWLACSTSSDNGYCSSNGGCVNGSSVLGAIGENTNYTCNETYFSNNPYACEVGDWSGKYGTLEISSKLKGSAKSESGFDVDGSDLNGYSVVFSCNDGTPAFCAPFEEDSNGKDEDRAEQEDTKSKRAQFTDLEKSSIILEKNGNVKVDLDLENLDIPPNCGDYLYYRVYTKWATSDVDSAVTTRRTTNARRLLQNPPVNTNTTTTATPVVNSNTTTTSAPVSVNTTAGATPTNAPTYNPTAMPTSVPINCSVVVGSFYDPTVTCATDTQHTDYCKGPSNGKLCSDTTYSYSCNATKDKYSCAPGDLSGKYGAIDLKSNLTKISIKTNDELMIALELLDNRSVVLQCSNTYEIVGCAEWTDYNGSSNSENGIPVWGWPVGAVVVVLLICGGVFLCRRCRSDDEYSRINDEKKTIN